MNISKVISSRPWWVWGLIIVAFIFLVNEVWGLVGKRSMFNMILDQIRTDQSNVIKAKEENEKMYEAEITRLENEIRSIRVERDRTAAETSRLRRLVNEKDAEIILLKKEREAIVVPSDPESLVLEFYKLGFRSVARRVRH